jgi:hypothetical protein
MRRKVHSVAQRYENALYALKYSLYKQKTLPRWREAFLVAVLYY